MSKGKRSRKDQPATKTYALVEALIFYTRKARPLDEDSLPEFIHSIEDVSSREDDIINLIHAQCYHRPGYVRLSETTDITTHKGEIYKKAVVLTCFNGTVRIIWATGRTK